MLVESKLSRILQTPIPTTNGLFDDGSHSSQAQADQRVPAGNAGPQLGPAVPAYEGGDWLTFIMDQAFSVGLWGGNPGMEPMEQGRGPLSNGVPMSTGTLQG